MQNELFGMYTAGKIKPNVMQTFAMEDFAAALALVKAGKVQGKVVLRVRHTPGAADNHLS